MPDRTQKFTLIDPPLAASQKAPLGKIVEIDGNVYVYCLFTEEGAGGETLTAGDVVFSNNLVAAAGDFEMNHFEAAGSVTIADMLGVFIGDGLMPDTIDDTTIVDGAYGWVQTYGYNASILMEDTAALTLGCSCYGVSGTHYCVIDTARGTIPSYFHHIISLEAANTSAEVLRAGLIRCRS